MSGKKKSGKLCNTGTLYNYNSQIGSNYDIVVGDDSKYILLNNRSFDNGLITVVIIIFLIILLFVIYFVYEYLSPRPVQSRDLISSTVSPSFFNGSSYTSEPACEVNDRSEWNEFKGACQCKPPYEGDMCQNDKLDDEYGIVKTSSDLLLDSIGIESVSNLSIPSSMNEISCTQLCDSDINCSAVRFIDDECNMLASITSSGRDENRTFYIRKDSLNDLRYVDRVFIYNGALTLNVINTERGSFDDPHLRAFSDRVYRLHFYPENILNSGELLGIFSVFPFKPEQFDMMVKQSQFNDSYIIDDGNLSLPIDWSDKNLWVMYSS